MLEFDRIRQSLKAGPLSEVYAVARALKRRLRREPLVGALPVTAHPLPLAPLHALSGQMAGHSRLHFSLALAYLEEDSQAGDRRALACLRNAEFLDFESDERLSLYYALIEARKGRANDAASLAASILPYDLTENEAELRRQLVSSEICAKYYGERNESLADCWHSLPSCSDGYSDVHSVLVCGDEDAVTSDWARTAKYLLVSPQVNGLQAIGLSAILTRKKHQFDVGIGSASYMSALKAAGICCADWITIDPRIPALN
jgi:hypothetical protein